MSRSNLLWNNIRGTLILPFGNSEHTLAQNRKIKDTSRSSVWEDGENWNVF